MSNIARYSAVGLALALFAMCAAFQNGLVVSGDSIHYLALADNTAHGKGYVDYTGKPPVNLACLPGYPLALTPFATFLVPHNAALAVNLLALAAVFVLAMLLLSMTDAPPWLRWFGAAAATMHPALVGIANCALSETLFTALTLAYLLVVLRSKHGLLIALTGLALCATRYIGLAVVVGSLPLIRGWWRRVVVFVPSAAMLVLFNSATSGVEIVRTPVLQVLGRVANGLAQNTGGFVMVAAFVVLGIVTAWRRERWSLAVASVALCYLVALAVATMFTNVDDLDARQIVPVAVLLTLSAPVWYGPETRPGRVMPCVYLGLVMFAGCLVVNTRFTSGSKDKLLASPRFSNAVMMELVRRTDADRIVSNCPEAIWWNTGKLTRRMPFKADDSTAIAAKLQLDSLPSVVVLWAEYCTNRNYLTPDQLVRFWTVLDTKQDKATGDVALLVKARE